MKRIKKLSLLLLMSAMSLYPAASKVGGGADCGQEVETAVRDFDGLPITIGSLCSAIEFKDGEMIRYIIDQNPELLDVSGVEYPNGVTPLHIAAFSGRKEAVNALLAAGANINAQTDDGMTPLYVAVHFEGEHKEVVAILLASGADTNKANEDGFTPLYVAAEAGNEKGVEALLLAGAEVNAQTKDGFTPLYFAAQEGHREVAKLLMAHGGCVTRVRYESLNPDKQEMVKDIWMRLYQDKQAYILHICQQAARRDVAERDVDRLPFTALPPEILVHIIQFRMEDIAKAWEQFLDKLPYRERRCIVS